MLTDEGSDEYAAVWSRSMGLVDGVADATGPRECPHLLSIAHGSRREVETLLKGGSRRFIDDALVRPQRRLVIDVRHPRKGRMRRLR